MPLLALMLMGAHRHLSSSGPINSVIAQQQQSQQNVAPQSASSSSSSSFSNSITQNISEINPTDECQLRLTSTKIVNHLTLSSNAKTTFNASPSKHCPTKSKPLLSTASTSVSGSSSGETVIEAKLGDNMTNHCNQIDNKEGDISSESSQKPENEVSSGAKSHRKNHCSKHNHHRTTRNNKQNNQESIRAMISDSQQSSSMVENQVDFSKCDVGIQVDQNSISNDNYPSDQEFGQSESMQSNGSAQRTNMKRHNKFSSNLIRSINRFNPFTFTSSHSTQHNHHNSSNHQLTDLCNDIQSHQLNLSDTNYQNHNQLAWYQTFAQRYLRRKSTCFHSSRYQRDLGASVNHKTHNIDADHLHVIPITVQSAPSTPVRWIESTTSGQQKPSGGSSSRQPATINDAISVEKYENSTAENGCVDTQTTIAEIEPNANLNNTGSSKPSVRFADETEVGDANSSRRVSSISELHEPRELEVAAVANDEDISDEHDELGELEEDGLDEEPLDEDDFGSKKASEIVEKLFQFPSTSTNGDLANSKSNLLKEIVTGTANDGECPMDSGHFRHYGYCLIDYVCNYLDTIKERRVTPLNIEPGYLKSLIEPAAPEQGEPFPKIMQDFEKHIMCGITHWQHPHFHAYFPAGNAYPSILADMLSDALGCVGFSWAASPAYTELEIIMLDWMGKMIGLPDEFLCLSGSQESRGGGVIQGSASECVLVNLLAARHWAIERLRTKYPRLPDGMLLSKLIGYCSKEAHSCVEKAAMIGFIRMRALDTDENQSLRGETLAKAIEADLEQGLEPFLCCATLGTTSCVSFDNLDELGTVCQKNDIWLHVDAAYAGSALICPEFKYLMLGIEKANSFNMNPNKWMLINFDCSLMWVKDRFKLTRAFVVDPLYLQHSYSDQAIDYRHWGIPLSRRFRALKLWFVIRNYGISGLQAYIRNHVKLAKLFETLIRADSRFAVTNRVVLGLVCFRLIGSNGLNQRLLSIINASGKLHMVPASVNGRYVIRFCICDQNAKEEDVRYAYQCIADFATELITSVRASKEKFRAISAQNTVEMLASALPIGIQSLDTNEPQTITESDRSESRTPLSRPGSRLSQRSVSMDSSRASPCVTAIAESQALIGSQSPRALESASSLIGPSGVSPRSNSRLGVSGSGAAVCKSPLTKQRSVLATDHDQPTVVGNEDEFAQATETNDGLPVSPGGGVVDQQSQQDSEQFKSAQQRRARVTSGRYKRKFFVRVVSDPRVYRASISGDINAHSSNGSLSGGACNSVSISNTSQQSISDSTTTTASLNVTCSNAPSAAKTNSTADSQLQ